MELFIDEGRHGVTETGSSIGAVTIQKCFRGYGDLYPVRPSWWVMLSMELQISNLLSYVFCQLFLNFSLNMRLIQNWMRGGYAHILSCSKRY